MGSVFGAIISPTIGKHSCSIATKKQSILNPPNLEIIMQKYIELVELIKLPRNAGNFYHLLSHVTASTIIKGVFT